jgi:hypothetical protein
MFFCFGLSYSVLIVPFRKLCTWCNTKFSLTPTKLHPWSVNPDAKQSKVRRMVRGQSPHWHAPLKHQTLALTIVLSQMGLSLVCHAIKRDAAQDKNSWWPHAWVTLCKYSSTTKIEFAGRDMYGKFSCHQWFETVRVCYNWCFLQRPQ